VRKHHLLQAPVRMLYKAAGPGAVKSLSNLVNALDKPGLSAVGGALTAYTWATNMPASKIRP
jgi:hypothetical protein